MPRAYQTAPVLRPGRENPKSEALNEGAPQAPPRSGPRAARKAAFAAHASAQANSKQFQNAARMLQTNQTSIHGASAPFRTERRF
jgi:hypothetical protein